MEPDLLVIGGAVGASLGGPAGWSAFLHVQATADSMKLCGVERNVLLNEADVLPFVAALRWYHDTQFKDGDQPTVLCCTDSPAMVTAGVDRALRNQDDWRALEVFEDLGYQIQWSLESRDRNPAIFQEAARVRRELIDAVSHG